MPRTLTLKIDDEDWDDYKQHFLLTHPNQTTDTDNILTDDDWIFYRILLFARGAYEKGVYQVFSQTAKPTIDKNIIMIQNNP